MKNRLSVVALALAGSIVAAPAFASGYGPAPHYSPNEGAPASQRGMSAQTVAAEQTSHLLTRKSDQSTDLTAAAQKETHTKMQ